mgnify:CR=1 FL=1
MKQGKSAKEIVLDVLRNSNKPLRCREIHKLSGLNYNTVRGRLQELKKKGIVKMEGGY